LRALEVTDQAAGYAFAAHHARKSIRRFGCSTRSDHRRPCYSIPDTWGRRHLGHDKAVGHIGYGSAVIDGEEVSFDELTSMLQTYEGWSFELRVLDPFDTL
jgi:hypothetical protein